MRKLLATSGLKKNHFRYYLIYNCTLILNKFAVGNCYYRFNKSFYRLTLTRLYVYQPNAKDPVALLCIKMNL